MITVKSTISIASQTVPEIIPVVQGDTGRSILFTLADFTIPNGTTATYYIQKPSGAAVYNAATIDGNTITVDLTAQAIAEYGDNYGQVRISDDGEIVTSFDFILLVKEFRGIDATESTSEMNIFDQAVQNAMAQIDNSLPHIVAPEFDSTATYAAGDYVIYAGYLYKFNSSHSGAWTGSDATAVLVVNEMGSSGGGTGLTETIKQALLQIAQKVAYIDANGQTYYNALHDALYPAERTITYNLTHVTSSNNTATVSDGSSYTATLTAASNYTLNSVTVTMGGVDITSSVYTSGTITIPSVTGNVVITATAVLAAVSIEATYTQSGTVYTTDTLDSLKSDLVVVATYADSSTATISSDDYELSGTLTEGTSTITVTYAGLTDTFNVTVTAAVTDTTAELRVSGYVLAHKNADPYYYDYSVGNGGITVMYDMDAATTVLNPAGIIPTTGTVMKAAPAALVIYDSDGTEVNFVSEASSTSFNRWAQDAEGTMTEYVGSWNVSSYSKIAFSVDIRYLDDAYMYDHTTGQVWFAGINTPYYGMHNISESE